MFYMRIQNFHIENILLVLTKGGYFHRAVKLAGKMSIWR